MILKILIVYSCLFMKKHYLCNKTKRQMEEKTFRLNSQEDPTDEQLQAIME